MRIVILGGGISGLSAAWRLRRSLPDSSLLLLEKETRLGGMMHTVVRDGFLFERGPRTFSATRSPELLKLIDEVGLKDELIFSSPRSSKRYLWHRGAMRPVGSILLGQLGRILLEPFQKRRVGDEESIFEFAKRRFGTTLAELLIDPLTLGIFGGESRELSCKACFPQWIEWEQRYGSVLLGLLCAPRSKQKFPGSLFTLKRGMGSLIDALARTPRLDVQCNQEVLAVYREGTEWVIKTEQMSYRADVLYSALPAHVLARFFPELPPISYASITVANIGLSSPLAYRGYGYLVPSKEQEALLGMIWDSEVFPEQGAGRLTAMLRPACEDPRGSVQDVLKRHLGVLQQQIKMIECSTYIDAIPQLQKEHSRVLAWQRSLPPNIVVLGNFLEGVSVEHCVAQSKARGF